MVLAVRYDMTVFAGLGMQHVEVTVVYHLRGNADRFMVSKIQ